MTLTAIEPLADVSMDPVVAALPKADLHVHAEAGPRLDRVLARRQGRPPYDWRGWVRRALDELPPGMPRLLGMAGLLRTSGAQDMEPEYFVARVADLLEESAADGATLVEVRFGREQALMPEFMPLFREAERQVQDRYPRLRADALSVLGMLGPSLQCDVDQLLDACLRLANEGLAGVDFLSDPYDAEADWTGIYRWAERAAGAGLGITVHAGEFSSANLAASLCVPGLKRIGHAVYAAFDPRLLDQLAASGVTVECSLSCNVVLGAVASYEEHPIRRFLEHGIPVTLNTDDPVRICTTIGREYAIAAALDFTPAELLAFTRSAVQASFTTADRRAALLADLAEWEAHQAWATPLQERGATPCG
jgi:adenosine deaminase